MARHRTVYSLVYWSVYASNSLKEFRISAKQPDQTLIYWSLVMQPQQNKAQQTIYLVYGMK